MRHRNRMRAGWAIGAIAGISCGLGMPARGDTTSTFSNFASNVSANAGASFEVPTASTVGQVTVDPNNADTIYAINRNGSGETPPGGVSPYSASTGAQISNSSGPIYLSSSFGSWTQSDPYGAVVGNDGSLYVVFSYTPHIYKVGGPLSDSPTVTELMGNYADTTIDDDPVGIYRMPANFGLAGYTSNDFIMFDSDTDDNSTHPGLGNTVYAIHADGSDGTNPAVVWQRGVETTSMARSGVNPVDGYAYFLSSTPDHATIDGTDYVTINRVKGDGVLQTIGLSLPAGISLDNPDDPVAINPADGSIWLAERNLDGTSDSAGSRTLLRIDTSSLTATGDANTFLASVNEEFDGLNFNMGVNGMTFAPDGTKLYAGTPNGTDKIYAFDVTPGNVPEPASLSLLALGGLGLLSRRRR